MSGMAGASLLTAHGGGGGGGGGSGGNGLSGLGLNPTVTNRGKTPSNVRGPTLEEKLAKMTDKERRLYEHTTMLKQLKNTQKEYHDK